LSDRGAIRPLDQHWWFAERRSANDVAVLAGCLAWRLGT